MNSASSAGCRLVIVGGGISGLAAAHRAQELARQRQQDIQVTLIESQGRLGGVISTVKQDGLIMERGPDSLITQKPWALSLCSRLGIESRLISTNENNRGLYVVNQGRLVSVPEGFLMMAPANWWSFICSPLFSWPGKLRMAMEMFLPAGEEVADESLAGFVSRRLGREALDRVAQPLVGGIYTADPHKLSLQATMPRFLDLERKYGSVIRGLKLEQPAGKQASAKSTGARYSLFASLDQGLQVLVDKLRQQLVDIRLGVGVSGISSEDGGKGWCLKLQNGESLKADAVIIATPAGQAASLLGDIDPVLSSQLSSISTASSAVLNLLYPRQAIPHPLNGFGFVVPVVERRSILACTFSSVKFKGRAPDDQVLMRVFLGGAMQPEIYRLTDEEMIAAARSDLRDLLGITTEPSLTDLCRHPDSMPQYEVGHLSLVEAIEARVQKLPGLFLAGNAYRGVGIPDCIHSGEQAAEAAL